MVESVGEASKVDGANSWQRLTRITIPLLKPIIIITLFLRGIDAFRTFDVIFVLTNGGPGTLTTTLSIFLYKTGFTQGNISVAATASIIIGLMLMIIMPFFIRQFRKTY